MPDNENIYGIKYEVNIDELKESTSEATKRIKLANAEFKASASSLDDWANSTTGLSAKIKQMNTILEANKSKLANLKKSYNDNVTSIEEYDKKIEELNKEKQNAIAQYGEESEEVKKLSSEITKLERQQQLSMNAADKLNIAILSQQATVNKTEKELAKYNAKLSELQAESTQTATATDKLKAEIADQTTELSRLRDEYANLVLEQGKSSTEAKELASKIKELNNNLADNKSKLSDAQKEAGDLASALDESGQGAEGASGGFTIMKGALADLTANAISAAISKIGDFVGALFSLDEATEEYRQMNAKIAGSANAFGYSVDFAKGKYEDFYAYLGDDQASTNAITNLMGMKVSTETVSEAANAAIGVWSAYGDSIPIEGLTESINESAQVAQVTGSLADAINWASRSNEDWTAAMEGHSAAQKAFNKAIADGESQEDAYSAALAACTDTQERADLIAQTLNQTYGDSKSTYDELTGGITDANRAELELKETQAELGKAIEPVNTAFTNLKNQALEFIAPLVQTLAEKFLDLNTYLKENPAVMQAITTVVIALAGAFGTLAVALGIQQLIKGVTTAFQLLNGAMKANPAIFIVSAITGLVAAFIYLWTTSEEFRQFWINLWEQIKQITSLVVEAISQFFSGLWQGIQNTFNSTVEWFSNLFSSAYKAIQDAFADAVAFFSGIWSGIQNALSTVKTWFSNMFTGAYNAVKNAFSSAVSFFSGIWKSIQNVFSSVKSWFSSIFSGAFQAVKNAFSGWASFFSGLWNSISSTFSSIGTKIANAISGAVKSGINGVIGQIENIINSGIGLINGAIGLINKIPGVNIGKMGLLNLPRLAQGGYALGSTLANIGEAGKEVVLPLDRNLGWAKTLASHLIEQLRSMIPSMNMPSWAMAGAGANVTFNQYNTSPKELDSLEIYRNTQKQINQFKKWRGK